MAKSKTPRSDALDKLRVTFRAPRTPAYGDALALCRRMETELSDLKATQAQMVLDALESGEWGIERNLPWAALTAEGNRKTAWTVTRKVAPFCAMYPEGDKRGTYGPRHWSGETAAKALKKAKKDLACHDPRA